MRDFSHWLRGYRKLNGYNLTDSKNKSLCAVTEKDLSDWEKYKVLPFIDLTLIARFEFNGKTITQEEMTSLIFDNEPNQDLDALISKLRRYTKRLAYWLIDDKTLNAINEQILSNTKD